MTSYLVVTPARDEAENLSGLAHSLASQTWLPPLTWVIVDDGSTDGTAEVARSLELPFPVRVVQRSNDGGLSRGSAFSAFLHGADIGVEWNGPHDRVMKLDADVRLDPGYFAALDAGDRGDALVGGVVVGPGENEQAHHVRGPLKAYRADVLDHIRALPVAPGWDVLDEVVLRAHGHNVSRIDAATATTARLTGSSEGLIRGRIRNGVISRHTGYDPMYFVLRCIRYAGRSPVGLGALAMLWGYLTAGRGPHDDELRRRHRAEQRLRLWRLVRSPRGEFAASFGAVR